MEILERRSSGVLLPLFSLRSAGSWGIGEFPDLAAIAPWMEAAGLSLLMQLPLLEASLGQESPYAALSAFALDPIYLSLGSLEDFQAIGGEASLSPAEREELEALRASETVDQARVRRLKEPWLRRSFARFQASEAGGSERAIELQRFREAHASWLDDYGLFRALKEREPPGGWWEWAPGLRHRDPAALREARSALREEVAYREYLQWNSFLQLREARRRARERGVHLGGDLPFMVAEDSADVWAHPEAFSRAATVGAPPDPFSPDGQDWGLPSYRWDRLAARGYDWLRERSRQAAELFDLVRIDHVVGFYRTYVRPRDGTPPHFVPAEEEAQRLQGEATMAALRSAGVGLIAEDLGTVPPFVRVSLEAIGIPGYRVLRWEQDGGRFREPGGWPALSLATTGTHDTEPIATWWDALPEGERQGLRQLEALRHLGDEQAARVCPAVHEALLRAVYGSGSNLLVLPVQDLFGGRERINLPGTVGPWNWSYRLPWPVETMGSVPEVAARTAALRRLAEESGRLG